MHSLAILVLLQIVCTSVADVHYVRPDDAPASICPSSPCPTLDQYARQTSLYFTTGSMFVFLPGNHSLQSSISLTSVSNITLRGTGSDSRAVIVSRIQHVFIVQNADGVSLEMLKFDQVESHYRREQEICPVAATLKILNSRNVVISGCVFQGSGNNSLTEAAAVKVQESNVTISGCLFKGNTAKSGGAICISYDSHLNLSGNSFIRNQARHFGGAISVHFHSTLLVSSHNQFSYNHAGQSGGAISCKGCTFLLSGNTSFEGNRAAKTGGAVSLLRDDEETFLMQVPVHLVITGTAIFSNNEATEEGGAMSFDSANAHFGEQLVLFSHNSARNGGAISCRGSNMTGSAMKFIGNVASRHGGGLHIGRQQRFRYIDAVVEISANFTQNIAECGGAVTVSEGNLVLRSVYMTGNSRSAVCTFSSNVNFTGVNHLLHNEGLTGGGIAATDSDLKFQGISTFYGNTATAGGAISSLRGKVSFSRDFDFRSDSTIFSNNKAISEGGAIYALNSDIQFWSGRMNFTSNSAERGGAMYFRSGSTLTLAPSSWLDTFNNTARQYGGVIYHHDDPTTIQCNLRSDQLLPAPHCFVLTDKYAVRFGRMTSHNDSAGTDGNFLYGGLLDKCTYPPGLFRDFLTQFFKDLPFYVQPPTREGAVSSGPYQLLLCNNSVKYESSALEVFPGQQFSVVLEAIAQGESTTATIVTAVTHKSRLRTFQTTQTISVNCSDLTYNLYSAEAKDQLILYPDGPCRDSGLARVIVNVTFLPCPDGFARAGETCVCEERLRKYNVTCAIDSDVRITKGNNSNFWMGALHAENGSYGGLILYKNCPTEYCKTQAVTLAIEDLDAQCDLNHSGVLCGQCASNYSLMLGSSRCKICSNHYLVLLLAFVVAGLALVAFLTFLKLTVATGTLNSLILYANIMQANKTIFLPYKISVLIAWLNLDLGIETCFYDGLTAYAQTWLQFVFPVYIWVLISFIILTAHYSVFFSRIIGSDPIAVLATLLLMSYAKILRIIIEVYSFVDLDYPEEEKVRVWLKDGNIPYLSSSHLVLTVVTSLVLVLFFLPYTLLLLLGHRLYPFTGRKHFRWFSRIKPLLESYYAPYKTSTRYWTGLLLLVRCALYIVFSFNSLGGTRQSLVAIILTFTALAILGSGRIYKSTIVNVVEVSMYFNLVVLSTATLAEYNWPWLVYLLVATVHVIMVCAIVYQVYLLYIAKTTLWVMTKEELSPYFHLSKISPQPEDPPPNPSQDLHKIVSKTVINLREPLMEN